MVKKFYVQWILVRIIPTLLIVVSILQVSRVQAQNHDVRGKITFISSAPQERITATSNKLVGLLDPKELSFAFVVDINSFDGFNSPLQRIHFNENYMETSKYPKSRFYGRLIENISIDEVDDVQIRAKGYLEIHGIRKERILQVILKRKNGILYFTSDFTLSLADYKISIPRIVHQKLSDQIEVHVQGTIRNQNP